MSFLHTYDLANANGFRPKVLVGMVKVAGTVGMEDRSNMNPARADKRRALAELALRQPEIQVQTFIWAVLANPVIAEAGLNASDGDIEYQITQIWDQVAGVMATEMA